MDGINTTPNQTGVVGGPATNSPMNQMPPIGNDEHKSSTGPIIGSIIVVLIVVLGGLYLYGQQLGQNEAVVPPQETSTTNETSLASIEQQGSSDDLGEINADLNSTDLDNLDSDMNNIDAELAI